MKLVHNVLLIKLVDFYKQLTLNKKNKKTNRNVNISIVVVFIRKSKTYSPFLKISKKSLL